MLKKNRKGFTLIEIIAVLVILGILAVVAVPRYLDLQDEARIKAASGAIAEVKGRYSLAYGKYLLENSGAQPASCAAILSDADAIDGLDPDYTVTLAGTAGATVTITVTQVDGVNVTVPTGTWTIPTQG
jgi:MSHA pilin protein MshA